MSLLGARHALRLGFQKFRIERVGGTLALEEGGDVLSGSEGHAAAGFCGSGAEVWGEDHVRSLEAGVHEGFLFEDVEAGAGNFLGFEGVDEGGFINNWPAGRVDQKGGRLHAEEFGSVEEAPRVAVKWDVE